MMGMICGFKKGFLVNVPSASAAISNLVTKSAKWRVSVKAMAAGLVVFANKALAVLISRSKFSGKSVAMQQRVS